MLTSGWAAAGCASPTGCYRHPSTAAVGAVIGQGLGPGCCPLLAKAEPVALRPSLGSAITCHIPSVTRTTLAVGEGTTRRTQPLTALRPTPTAPLSRPHTLPGPDACVALSGSGHCHPAGRGHRSRGLEPPILPPRPGVQIRAPPQAGDKLLWPQFPRGPFTRLHEAQGVVWAGVCRPRSSLNRPPPRCLASTPTHTALHCPSAG